MKHEKKKLRNFGNEKQKRGAGRDKLQGYSVGNVLLTKQQQTVWHAAAANLHNALIHPQAFTIVSEVRMVM